MAKILAKFELVIYFILTLLIVLWLILYGIGEVFGWDKVLILPPIISDTPIAIMCSREGGISGSVVPSDMALDKILACDGVKKGYRDVRAKFMDIKVAYDPHDSVLRDEYTDSMIILNFVYTLPSFISDIDDVEVVRDILFIPEEIFDKFKTKKVKVYWYSLKVVRSAKGYVLGGQLVIIEPPGANILEDICMVKDIIDKGEVKGLISYRGQLYGLSFSLNTAMSDEAKILYKKWIREKDGSIVLVEEVRKEWKEFIGKCNK